MDRTNNPCLHVDFNRLLNNNKRRKPRSWKQNTTKLEMIALRGKLEKTKVAAVPKEEVGEDSIPKPETPATCAKESLPVPAASSSPSGENNKAQSEGDTTASENTTFEWAWKGHWAFGLTMPEDESKWQPFEYKWSRKVDPETVLVVSLNYTDDDDEEDDEDDTIEKGEHEKVEANALSVTSAASVAANNGERDSKSAQEDVADSKAEQGKPATNTELGSDKKDEATSGRSDNEDAKESSSSSGEEKQAQSQPNKEESDIKKDGKDHKTEKEEDDIPKPSSNDKNAPTDIPSTAANDPATAKHPKITFATPLSPEDPPFTDAATIYPDKCPEGGEWKGYFTNTFTPMKKNRWPVCPLTKATLNLIQ